MKKAKKVFTVYKAVCTETNKIYIGQTVSFNDRKRNHINAAFNPNAKDYDTYFHRAIRKYGKDKFEWEILNKYETQEMMDAGEIFYIKFYDCIAPKGYNSIEGGRCSSPRPKYNIRKSQKGELNHQYGKKGKLSPHHRPVMNMTTGKKYDSIRELCLDEFNDIKYVKNVSRVCNQPRRHTFRGNEYRFLDENYEPIKKINIFGDGVIRKIKNLETNEIYENMGDASRKLKIPEGLIKDKLYGSIKKSKKYPMLNALIFYQANGETPEKDNTVPSAGNGEGVTTNL